MKTLISFLAGSLIVFMFACHQPEVENPEPETPELPESEPHQFVICEDDAIKELSREPIEAFFVETEYQNAGDVSNCSGTLIKD